MATGYAEKFGLTERTNDVIILKEYVALTERLLKLMKGINEKLPEEQRRVLCESWKGKKMNPITWEVES